MQLVNRRCHDRSMAFRAKRTTPRARLREKSRYSFLFRRYAYILVHRRIVLPALFDGGMQWKWKEQWSMVRVLAMTCRAGPGALIAREGRAHETRMGMGSDVWCTPRWGDPGRSTYGKCYVPRVVAFPIQIQSRSAWPMHACMCVCASVRCCRPGRRSVRCSGLSGPENHSPPPRPRPCISSICVNRLIWLDQSLRSAS